VKAFLSSYRLGDHADDLLALVPPGRIALSTNALDNQGQRARETIFRTERAFFERLGYAVEELDLRRWFGRADAFALATELSRFDLVWATGGNSFGLNLAMKLARFPDALRAAGVAYGGYSAGAVVAATTLHGVEHCDAIDDFPPEYPSREVVWDGMRIVDFAIVPHWQADYEEARGTVAMVAELERRGEPYRTLRDDEVVIVRE